MSSFYKYSVVAKIGDQGIQDLGNRVSINDAGKITFNGDLNSSQFGENAVFVWDGTLNNISSNTLGSNINFGTAVQINNQDKVIANWRRSNGVGATYLYNGNSTNDFTVLASAGGSNDSSPPYNFDYYALLPVVGLNNNDQTVFTGFREELDRSFNPFNPFNPISFSYLPGDPLVISNPDPVTRKRDPNNDEKEIIWPSPQISRANPVIADDGSILMKFGTAPNSPLRLYDNDLSSFTTIADSSNFTSIGSRPNISDDGQIVVFAGDRGNGTEIFLGSPLFPFVIPIAGENGAGGSAELGYDDAGNPISFDSIDLDDAIGVTRFDLGASGLEDDSIVVTFMGTPNSASVTNPVTGNPLLFDQKEGIWKVRVDFESELSGSSIVAHPTGAVPVVQIDDKINGATIKDLNIYDPISNATQDLAGNPRSQQLGEHRVAFWADTTAGDMVVTAEHLDSDGDGLLDHWETNGIDIDRDGTIDLDLSAMGADPMRKDIFLEIDWLVPRTDGVPTPWKNEPTPAALQNLVNMFAAAPVTNPDGSNGITMHIDAGSGLSINMGSGSLQGGDPIAQRRTRTQHIDVVYFGEPGSINVPGVETRSFHDIKDNFFGTTDKRARELAFSYSVLADFHSFIDDSSNTPFQANVTTATNQIISGNNFGLLSSAINLPPVPGRPNLAGQIIKITSGTGAGQLRNIIQSNNNDLVTLDPWTTIPDATSQFALISGSSGRAEVDFYGAPDHNGVPGNDFLVTLGGFGVDPNGFLGFDASTNTDGTFFQWRTMAHEFGHTLGLRHGGTDQNAYKGNSYLSLMSYSHQNTVGSPVSSYSGAGDPTFNDWADIELDFINAPVHLGNTYGFGLGTTATADPSADLEYTFDDFQRINNPQPEENKPSLNIQSPTSATTVSTGSDLSINLTATDDSGIGTINISFDLNGDGDTEDSGETVLATNTAGDAFEATFSTISGSAGNRTVWILAEDIHGNLEIDTVEIDVTTNTINTPPVANNDTATTNEDTAVTISVLVNDTDVDLDSLSIDSFDLSSTEGGMITLDDNNTPADESDDRLIYTPATGFTGTDTFEYIVSDGQDSDTATVEVTVNSVVITNNPPVANNDTATINEDTAVTISVLANDTDADLDSLSIDSFDATSTEGGTIALDDNNTPTDESDDRLIYTPATGFTGTDTFEYIVTDGQDSDTATVEVTVDPDDGEPNIINGTTGRDILTGTDGDDIITGDFASDRLTGGLGNDTFVYKELRDVGDTITDFTLGEDTIDFSDLLSNLGISSARVGFADTPSGTAITLDSHNSGIFRNFLLVKGDGVNAATLNDAENLVF